MKKQILSFLTAASLTLSTIVFSGTVFSKGTVSVISAEAVGLNVKTHTSDEIRMYIKSHPFDTDKKVTYTEQPSVIFPYYPGAVSNDDLINGLNALNCMRYIAGLDEVKLKDEYNTLTQAAAMLNAANQELSHQPKQPADMNDSLYKLGYDGTSSSNLSYNRPNFASAVINGFMGDTTGRNITTVGHRRWCLNPSMQYTGFGKADSYIAMYTFDNLNFSPDAGNVCWPAQNTPVNYCNSSLIWSYSAGFKIDESKINVTVTRKADSKTWHFNSKQSDGEFYVNNDYYGLTGCVIFQPSEKINYSDGDVFDVNIDGIGNGVSYTVNFFELNPKISGDFDNNGNISSSDLMLLTKYMNGFKNITADMSLADINHDNIINILDVIALKNMLL